MDRVAIADEYLFGHQKNAQDIFHCLCENPHGLTNVELIRLVYGAKEPDWAANGISVSICKFNQRARRIGAALRIKSVSEFRSSLPHSYRQANMIPELYHDRARGLLVYKTDQPDRVLQYVPEARGSTEPMSPRRPRCTTRRYSASSTTPCPASWRPAATTGRSSEDASRWRIRNSWPSSWWRTRVASISATWGR